MDCEKFDLHVMDALYGELDELTLEAQKRHADACGRCGPAWANLKATREAVSFPLVEPPPDLERRILAAERAAHGHAPWYKKIVRAAAWAGSHAMRPQLAMAALFMFVIGSSLLLLRARPGTLAPPVQISEQGNPEKNRDDVPPTATPAAAPRESDVQREPGAVMGRSLAATTPVTAEAAIAPIASATPSGGDSAAATLLALALAKKAVDGCAASVPMLRGLMADYPDSPEKRIAEREILECETGTAPAASASASSSPAPSSTASSAVPPAAPTTP
ncbi:MAG: zf-HC2 domain-containing protein [Polyangiaceae bacterium]